MVLGNPPWDVVLPNTKDFVADLDPAMLDARTRADRAAIEQAVLARPDVAAAFEAYRAGFEPAEAHRVAAIPASARPQWRRAPLPATSTCSVCSPNATWSWRRPTASIGVLMPSAFHANEGTTGIRRLYLQDAEPGLVPVVREPPPHLRHRQPLQVRPDRRASSGPDADHCAAASTWIAWKTRPIRPGS